MLQGETFTLLKLEPGAGCIRLLLTGVAGNCWRREGGQVLALQAHVRLCRRERRFELKNVELGLVTLLISMLGLAPAIADGLLTPGKPAGVREAAPKKE